MCDVTISTFEFMELFGNENDTRGFFEEQRWGGKEKKTSIQTKN